MWWEFAPCVCCLSNNGSPYNLYSTYKYTIYMCVYVLCIHNVCRMYVPYRVQNPIHAFNNIVVIVWHSTAKFFNTIASIKSQTNEAPFNFTYFCLPSLSFFLYFHRLRLNSLFHLITSYFSKGFFFFLLLVSIVWVNFSKCIWIDRLQWVFKFVSFIHWTM